MLSSHITKEQVVLVLTGLGVVLLDQVSKNIVELAGYLTVLNTGISFGIAQFVPVAWLTLGLLLLSSGLIFWQWRFLVQFPIPSGMFLGGVLSNLLDRGLHGGVRDWLYLPGLNLYNNIADWAVFIGVVLITLRILKKKKHEY